ARGPALLRFAYVLTTDAHAAEDLVQSALADAYRHWRRVQQTEQPDAYVRKIVVNRHLSGRRRRWWGEHPTDSLDGLLGGAAGVLRDPADAVVERDAARAVLDGLPRRARAILVLRYYADLDDRAIAETLGIAESTVRATASRALATLREAHAPTTDSAAAHAAATCEEHP
ncbi:MAG TPA: SigE family RNA polymerase sigma factor, partial [Candidatus Limnocylindria bacterium]|nr:SigE family RNA polymerase sigma factor [Candidatus Limnocylindria bacterium]